jgi:menaquinone-specific isochorismate synthase
VKTAQPQQLSLADLKEALQRKILALERLILPIGSPHPIYRLEFKCQPIDLLSWLQAQGVNTKIYWANRDGEFEMAGVGIAEKIEDKEGIDYQQLFEDIHERFTFLNPNIKFYGGVCFDPNNLDDNWEAFGAVQFVVPRFEILQKDNDAVFACNISYKDITDDSLKNILTELESLKCDDVQQIGPLAKPGQRKDTPNRAEWQQIFEQAFSGFARHEYQKIVLARKSTFTFQDDTKPFLMKKYLKGVTPECFHFCFQAQPGHVFIGASPERLYSREGRSLQTEALAGTRTKKGKGRGPSLSAWDGEQKANLKREDTNDWRSPEIATRFRGFNPGKAKPSTGLAAGNNQSLLDSPKDILEHKYVVDAIEESLRPLCASLNVGKKPFVLDLNWGEHLKTEIQATLNNEVTDAQLLEALHPTPAVAGYPVEKVLPLIKKFEPFSRGWYAGLFGYVGHDTTEFTVAIRSGLINKNRITLFAGAGILPESNEASEWDEIEQKMNSFLKVFE